MQWFVNPETARLMLEDEQWIVVKKVLNTGEVQDMYAAMRREDGSIDPGKVGLAKVQAYLIEWSLTQGGKPVPISNDALRNLHPEAFRTIREAVVAHEERLDEELEARKKSKAGETSSPAISASAA